MCAARRQPPEPAIRRNRTLPTPVKAVCDDGVRRDCAYGTKPKMATRAAEPK